MSRKKFSPVAALLLICVFLCACRNTTQSPNANGATPASLNARQGTLNIYYYEAGSVKDWYAVGIERFQTANPGVTLTVETFTTVEEMEQRLQSEWAVGKGPDVVLFSDANTLDIMRLAQNGTFADLGEHMGEFDNLENQYLDAAWDMGRMNGKTYIFPIGISTAHISTSTELMEQYNVAVDSDTTFMELLSALGGILDRCKNVEDVAGVAYKKLNYNRATLPYLMWMHDGFIIDGLSGTVSIDATQLQTIADFAVQADAAHEKGYALSQKYGSLPAELYSRFGLFLSVDGILALGRERVAIYKAALDQEHILIPITSQTGNLTAELSLYGCVSASSKDIALGISFLHTVAQEYPLYQSYFYSPANTQTAIMNAAELRTRNGSNVEYAPGKTTQIKAITQARYEQLTEWILGIDTFYLPNHKVENIIQDAMSPYLAGEQSFDVCYDDMMRRLNLYLNE